jgi:hypothetical protein
MTEIHRSIKELVDYKEYHDISFQELQFVWLSLMSDCYIYLRHYEKGTCCKAWMVSNWTDNVYVQRTIS